MQLSELFDYLVYGELSRIKIGDKGSINSDDYPMIVTNINLAMIALHKRFPLLYREVNIDLRNEITVYNLHSDYAQSNQSSSQPIKYIIDGTAAKPFSDDIILITNVYDELGEELPLNDLDEETSVFTPSSTMLQVPEAYDENSLSIIYQAKPDKIDYDILTDPSEVDVPIPPQFIEALTSYVAWRIFAPMDTNQGSEANTFYAKYEQECQLAKELGILNTDSTKNLRFGESGWR
jgi:hypothetical protein